MSEFTGPWRVMIWCRDCLMDNDSAGCFGGDKRFLEDADGVCCFWTEAEATAAGEDATNDGQPWDFEPRIVFSFPPTGSTESDDG